MCDFGPKMGHEHLDETPMIYADDRIIELGRIGGPNYSELEVPVTNRRAQPSPVGPLLRRVREGTVCIVRLGIDMPPVDRALYVLQ